MIFEPGQKILFAGDSITDSDRRGYSAPYGDGYVSIVRNMLLARCPELHLRFANRGVSGDTTRDLRARWKRDVISEKPDWLSVKIGINDVWRHFQPGLEGDAVPLAEYVQTLNDLVQHAVEATGCRLILMQPYIIEPDRSEPMRKKMDEYGAAVAQLAQEQNAFFVPTQQAFDRVLENTSPLDWSEDRVHPNGAGHTVIALAFLQVSGFQL